MPMPFPSYPIDGASGGGISGDRGPTVVPAPDAPSPEISPRHRRGGLSPQDKLRILVETDQTAGAGGIGATLRREGL
jgi:hypothetical protein